jgi:hypothetical protein
MSSGGKGGKSAKAPDYTALANQQAQLNMQAAQQQTSANRPNQYDAFGNSVTWSQEESPEYLQAKDTYEHYMANSGSRGWDPALVAKDAEKLRQKMESLKGQGKWTQQQTMSPELKQYWDQYNQDSGQAAGALGQILNSYLANYQAPTGYGNFNYGDFNYGDFSSGAQNVKAYNDPEFEGKAVSDALYGSVMDRGRVEQQRESDQLNTQLRQQGLVPGSEAYNRAMQNLMTSQNDANLLASQNATLAGANEARAKYGAYLQGQGQQYGQDLTTYGTNRGNALENYGTNRNNALENYGTNLNTFLTNRNQPLQELAGLAGIAGGQPYSPSYPSFSGSTGYQPADLVGAAQAQYASKQNSANASNSKKSGMLGAGASLGGSYLGSK